ncbi:SirB2 family protein [Noviherbaspirillum denitrificans]|uniref:Regulator SirB n=1 Tax=Noviherbaspirillum denitrificans TaxID=1968433 RepID=A0A254TBI0_9BURK|nr:SirB2 family protein [Noviherbaspirillum denitrificans]OWW19905.1 regulator SirB [Noviherbaspirillum denitrificans]
MSYLALKHLHMSFAFLSGSLFLIRGVLMLRQPEGLPPRTTLLDRGSHIIDTILLASALTMVVWSAQYPFVVTWLTVKVFAVLAYIVVGAIALRRGKTKGVRTGAFFVALLIFGYILKLAITKQVA